MSSTDGPGLTRGRRLATFLAAAVLTAAGAAGCGDRSHLTPDHGRSFRGAFAAQAANPQAGQQPHKLPPLDAQEASVVASNYRRSLATKGTQPQDDGGMLILAAPQRQGQAQAQPYLPPPSVPQEKR